MSQKPNVNQQVPALAGVVGQVGCATVIIIGLALAAGFLLDNLLGTRPIFLILGLVGSVPVTLYTIVRVTTYTVERAQKQMNEKAEDESNE